MAKIKGHSYWPPPVYVARFADGTECRMSIWSREGKPLDFERGRGSCCSAIGAERALQAHITAVPYEFRYGRRGPVADLHPDSLARVFRAAGPATDIIAGHFEHDGQIVPDPHFAAPEPAAKPKLSQLDRLIASINKLGAEDLLRLTDAIEHAFETAE